MAQQLPLLQREPTSPHNPMLPLGIKAVITPLTNLVTSALSTWYQSSTSLPMLVETVGTPQLFPGSLNSPVMDATATENGVKLKKGVYRFELDIRAGDVTVAGTAEAMQFAVITKDTADSTGLILLSGEFNTPGHAGGDLSLAFWQEDIVYHESGWFEITVDDTTVQVVGRRTVATAGAAVIKRGVLMITKVANAVEARA